MLAEGQGLDEKKHRLRQASSGMRTGPLGLSVYRQKWRGIPISARRKVNSCFILLYKYTCVPPSAAVARSREDQCVLGENADFSSQLPIVSHSLTVHDFT
jgi:hypothetical protein